MAYIRRKKIKGNTYYYAVEYANEKGKRRQKVIAYLGTADNILRKLGIKKDKK